MGHGNGAHAPDEYYLIESSNPKIQDFDGATMSFVEYLYEFGKIALPGSARVSRAGERVLAIADFSLNPPFHHLGRN